MPTTTDTTNITDLQTFQTNNQVPLVPSIGWQRLQADVQLIAKGINVTNPDNNPTWNWIQAFWDTTMFTGNPVLAVWGGVATQADNNQVPILTPIQFSYSGERVYFKGKYIFDSGVDRFGNPITSTVIGSNASSNILQCYMYGGYSS
jgi:hypothetical protein